eukprot:12954072-Alexandrium_andersonii.AAC.1
MAEGDRARRFRAEEAAAPGGSQAEVFFPQSWSWRTSRNPGVAARGARIAARKRGLPAFKQSKYWGALRSSLGLSAAFRGCPELSGA